MQRERELEHLFEESLKKEEFQIYFQPKINLSKKKITGAEVLVRWIIPEEGIVSPGEFIPLLEKNGKIRILDRYVFEKTCIWLKKWCDQGKAVFPVSVNLSRAHFVDENFLEDFVKISQQYQIDRGLIEFEITETVLLDASQIKNVRESLQKIHQYGFQCSIDDFGVGYSSLSLLQEFDIDTLKLDRSFFQDIHNSKARGVVECIVDIAKKLDMKTVVEGIETLQQVQYLKEMHCDTVQGFFFSRPLSIEDFEKWISQFQISNYISNEQAELVVCDENQNSIRDEGLNREKRLKYLDCMPVACCCVQILFNEKGEPDDFYFIYANRTQEMLNNMKPGSLVGKRFSDIFENADSEWSRCYYKTAYEGKSQIIRRYSREIEKYLLIHTFQLEQGSCGCVLLDVSVHERRVLGYMQNIQDIMSQQERLRKQAQVDSLTGIMNVGTGRMLIEGKLEQQEEGVCNAFFVMDIDDFKQINDTQGHMMGDEILKAFAEALKKTFRSEDVIYRLGGDEFAAFAFDIHRPEISIENIMQRFIKNISQARETFPLLYSSVGIFVSNKKHHFEDYYREADLALYETKNDGKNKYTVRKDFSDM